LVLLSDPRIKLWSFNMKWEIRPNIISSPLSCKPPAFYNAHYIYKIFVLTAVALTFTDKCCLCFLHLVTFLHISLLVGLLLMHELGNLIGNSVPVSMLLASGLWRSFLGKMETISPSLGSVLASWPSLANRMSNLACQFWVLTSSIH
jgi:hypothetical protein